MDRRSSMRTSGEVLECARFGHEPGIGLPPSTPSRIQIELALCGRGCFGFRRTRSPLHGLYSEAAVIQEQARQAQLLKDGENFSPVASGAFSSEKQTKEPKP